MFSLKINNCTSVYHNNNTEPFIFQKVDESVFSALSHIYVYSAFYETRKKRKVIVISVSDDWRVDLKCIIWFSGNDFEMVTGTMENIPEDSGRRYKAGIIHCPMENKGIPLYVTILSEKCGKIQNLLQISIIPNVRTSSDIAICVTPFNLAYNKVDQFIETMSLNRMFGASHTYFYNYSTGRNIEKIIDVYKNLGVATVLPFHLPMKVHIWPLPKDYNEEVKYFGQMAALNDCLYRTMGHYQYVVFSDLDEYLVPRKTRNWRELIAETSPNATAWLFRNAFFKTEWPSDAEMMNNKTIRELKTMSLVKLLRTPTIEAPYQRSKLIVDPYSVVIMGVHNVWSFVPNYKIHILSIDDGLCHHYRFWDGIGEKASIRDDNILRLREDIVSVVQEDRKMLSHLL